MKKNETAAVRINVYFVSYGMQADLFINGVKVATKCRDFADEHSIGVLTEELANRLGAVVDDFCSEK